MLSFYKKIHAWILKNIHNPATIKIYYFMSFIESSFFPIPIDPFLAGLIMLKPESWKKLFVNSAIFSVLGGIFGYILGFWFFDLFGQKIIDFYSLQKEVSIIENMFNQNAFWAMFISAFTPIPYKIFTISAGLFKINFLIFIIASVLGRGLRFFVVAYIFRYLGQKFADKILKYFNWLTFILGLLILLYLII